MIDSKPTIVYFNSRGGSIDGALALGRMIRSRRFATSVGRLENERVRPAVCLSACVYAFVGGLDRRLPQGSDLGVHSAQIVGGLVASDEHPADRQLARLEVAVPVISYVQSMQVHQDLVLASTLISPESMCFFRRRQLERWNVVTTGATERASLVFPSNIAQGRIQLRCVSPPIR
jgi:hypothetical protein